jgi:hypothetical protein
MAFSFPTSYELMEIERQIMPRLQDGREIFTIFPTNTVDAPYLRWVQRDNFRGLQQLRGLNGMPPRVTRLGAKEFLYRPGVYGEYIPLDEEELTERRDWMVRGAPGTPISLDDLVAEVQLQLLIRRIDRIEQIVWTLLVTGTFAVSSPNGAILHTDTFAFQGGAAIVPWATFATAQPLNDFRNAQLAARGKGVVFDANSQAWMNQKTFNNLINNQNQNDLAGRRVGGFGTINNMEQVNTLLAGDNLPQIRIYEQGYRDENDTFQLFIPDNVVVIVGRRPGNQRIGEYRFTRNASNRDMAAGPYTRVIDNADGDPPRELRVHDGHNGGPVVFFPSAFYVLTT